MDDTNSERRVLEATTVPVFSDTEAQKVRMVVELPREQKAYDEFVKRGWKDVTNEDRTP